MSKYTKQAIVDTFVRILGKKPLSKITVTEIIDACELNRNTFYYYFEDINTLVDYWFYLKAHALSAEIEGGGSFNEKFQIIYGILKDNRSILKNIYCSTGRVRFEAHLFQALNQALMEYVGKCLSDMEVQEADVRFIVRYHGFAFAGHIIDWLVNEKDEHLEDLIQRCSTVSAETVRERLKIAIRSDARQSPGGTPEC